MTSQEIRQKYIDFFKAKNHAVIPSASLIPENDPSLLFTNSGMSPLIPYLLGEKHPLGQRLVNSQKCFRTEDIEEVGDNRHNTFFEMLGNWSLGDYFKKEQLSWYYEWLVDELGIDPQRLYQTVYIGDKDIPADKESVEIIKEVFAKYNIEAEQGEVDQENDFSKQRIFAYQKKNWWQRGDAVGELGGPDSETFYDTGKEHDPQYGPHCHPNCECGRFIEIGNSVFMQYQKTEQGWQETKNRNVDFGGGLERMAMVLQKKDNIFETDLFINIIDKIAELSQKKYGDNNLVFEVIADHLKAATFLMGDEKGITPSNVDQGYIIRRLIRRAIRYGRQLDIKQKNWLTEIVKIIIQDYEYIYQELKERQDFIISNLEKEAEKFAQTLERGLKEIRKIAQAEKQDTLALFSLSGEQLFKLYQTYGFPIEMTIEEIDKIRVSNGGQKITEQEKQTFLDLFKKEEKKHQELSRTASAGKFKGGLADQNEQTARLHTATHLLLAALRQVLGDHVYQKGSNITAERLRLDYSHSEKLTPEQKVEVEKIVNEAIQKDLPVEKEEMSLAEAKQSGAMGVFDSKYQDRVLVFTIRDHDKIISREICGGPHAQRTKELGRFKIKKEESSSAGIRRIKAILE